MTQSSPESLWVASKVLGLCAIGFVVLGCFWAWFPPGSFAEGERPAPVPEPVIPVTAAFKESSARRVLDFEDTAVGELPKGLAVASAEATGRPSFWHVIEDPTSPKGKNVVCMKDREEGSCGGALLEDSTVVRDVVVSASFKTVGGSEQMAGLVARYQDADNCYSLRINPGTASITLTRIVDGHATQLGERRHRMIAEGEWHQARLEAKGKRIMVHVDEQLAFEATDELLGDAGRAGVWVMSSSLTCFDDIEIESLDSN
jgi:hypothetical protein